MGSFYRGSEDNGGLALQAVQKCQQEQWLLHSSTDQLVFTQLLGQLVPAHINSRFAPAHVIVVYVMRLYLKIRQDLRSVKYTAYLASS